MTRTNIPFLVRKQGSPSFFDLGNFLNLDLKIVICLGWGNCCQFGEYFLTAQISGPNLPRQLKTHISFSMFPIFDTNLWHTYWNLMMKSLKCYMKRTILIEFLYIPHKYNGMCYVRLALLFLLFEKESRPY